MTALVKHREYDWKDSNLALFGSDLERQVKKDSAEEEPAWRNTGKKVGVQIWRIVKFQVTEWPEEDYGKFYNGDSYIVLNTYTEGGSDRLLYDVHFWIGKYSTQDEYGTAAYKTVELDTYLDDIPIQHREVQGYESSLFKSYFKTITIMEGGAESGFNRQVKTEDYEPRLFHLHGDRKNIEVRQIPRNKNLLDPTDVYILDSGLKIYQLNGEGANVLEKSKGMEYVQSLIDERPGKHVEKETLDGYNLKKSHMFYSYLNEETERDDSNQYTAGNQATELFRLSDQSGDMTFTKEKEGHVTKSDFDGKDVFILDTKKELFVWIGKQTTQAEKKNALAYAHRYLQRCDHPFLPVSCFSEGKTTKAFETAIAA